MTIWVWNKHNHVFGLGMMYENGFLVVMLGPVTLVWRVCE